MQVLAFFLGAFSSSLGHAQTYEKRTPLTQTARGQLVQVTSYVDGTADPTLKFDVSIPFVRVYAQAVREIAEIVPPGEPWRSSLYGALADNPAGPKGRLFDVNLDSVSNPPYSVGALTFPVILSSIPRNGLFTEMDLDDHTQHQRTSSFNFGDDLSVRFYPGATRAAFEMCLNVPGEEISTPVQTTIISAGKLVQPFKMTLAAAAFDYGRKCELIDWSWTSSTQESLGVSQRATFANVQLEPMQADTPSPLNIYIPEILEQDQEAMLDRIKKAGQPTDHQVEAVRAALGSGQWLINMHGMTLLRTMLQAYSETLRAVFVRVGIPQTSTEFRQMLTDQCLLLQASHSAQWTASMEQLCQSRVSSVQAQAVAWDADISSFQSGCYDGFARVREPRDSAGNAKWWNDKCWLNTRLTVAIPEAANDDEKNLKILMENFVNEAQPPEWQNSLALQQIDDYELALLLEQWVKMGRLTVDPQDWSGQLASMLTQLRSPRPAR